MSERNEIRWDDSNVEELARALVKPLLEDGEGEDYSVYCGVEAPKARPVWKVGIQAIAKDLKPAVTDLELANATAHIPSVRSIQDRSDLDDKTRNLLIAHRDTLIEEARAQCIEEAKTDAIAAEMWKVNFLLKLGISEEKIRAIAQATREATTVHQARRMILEAANEGEPRFWFHDFSPLSTWTITEPVEIVKQILIEGQITVNVGPPEVYKSMSALEICAAVRQGRPAFDHFEVKQKLEILYLCPDMSPGAFLRYARCFGLDQDPGFLGISPTCEGVPNLDDEKLHDAVQGRVLVLDTMLDFAAIQEAGQSAEWVTFFGKLRALITQHGCKAVLLIAHSSKAGAKSAGIDPADFFKDSVSFLGKTDLGFGFKREPNSSKIWVERLKNGRFYESKIKFTVTPCDEEGNSYLSQGRFPICETPEQLAGQRIEDRAAKPGRKAKPAPEWLSQAIDMSKKGLSHQEIADGLGIAGLDRDRVRRALNKKKKQDELPF